GGSATGHAHGLRRPRRGGGAPPARGRRSAPRSRHRRRRAAVRDLRELRGPRRVAPRHARRRSAHHPRAVPRHSDRGDALVVRDRAPRRRARAEAVHRRACALHDAELRATMTASKALGLTAARPRWRGADAALAALVIAVVGLMVVPLPTWLLDLLI